MLDWLTPRRSLTTLRALYSMIDTQVDPSSSYALSCARCVDPAVGVGDEDLVSTALCDAATWGDAALVCGLFLCSISRVRFCRCDSCFAAVIVHQARPQVVLVRHDLRLT